MLRVLLFILILLFRRRLHLVRRKLARRNLIVEQFIQVFERAALEFGYEEEAEEETENRGISYSL